MTDQTDLDRIRGAALDRVDRARKAFWAMVILTGISEAALLIAVMLQMDFDDPLHKLLLAIAGLIYITLGTAIMALGAYMSLCTQRVLKGLSVGG